MKKIISLVLVLQLILQFSVAFAADTASENYLIENGTFDSSIDGWTANAGMGRLSDPALVYSDGSLEFIQGAAQYPIVRPTAGINLEKGSYYVFSADIRLKGHSYTIRAGLGCIGAYDNILALYKDYSRYITIPDNWSTTIRDQDVYSYKIQKADSLDEWTDWVHVENVIYAKADIAGAKLGITTACRNEIERWNIDNVSMEKIDPTYEINGSDTIEIPKYNEANATEQYVVEAKLNDVALTNDGVVYELGEAYDGVSIDESTGVLTVTDKAHLGNITVKAKHQENVITRTVELTYSAEKKPELRNLKLVGAVEQGNTLNVSYDLYDPCNKNATVEYEWFVSNDINGDWIQLENTDDQFYIPADFEYNYVKAGLKVTNEDGLSSNYETNMASAPMAPVAGNVRVVGRVSVGANVEAKFDFSDVNNDEEGQHIYTWLKSDMENGSYTEIAGQTTKNLLIDDSLSGKYIKVRVIPVSTSYPEEGEAAESTAYYVSAHNYIENGTFDINIDGWTANAGMGRLSDPALVYSDGSLEFIQGSAQYPIVRPEAGINLEKGNYYVFSADIRIKGHSQKIRAGFGSIGAYDNILALYKDYSSYITIPDNWSKTIREQDVYSYRIPTVNSVNEWSDWVHIENVIYAKADISGAKLGITTSSSVAVDRWNIDNVSMVKIDPAYKINGSDTIEIPKYNEADATEQYVVEAKLNNVALTNDGVVYELGEAYDGVSINESTGVLTVTDEAHTGDITVKAKHQENVVTRTVKLTYNAEKKPELRDLKLVGTVTANGELKVMYNCYDPDGLPTTVTTKWYVKSEQGEWTEVPELLNIENYIIPSDFAFNSVKVIVDATNENGNSGEVETNIAVAPTAPTAENVQIVCVTAEKKNFVGQKLEGKYTFSDVNLGDTEGVSTYQWYVCDTENGTYTPIEGATTKTYTISEQDAYKFIKFGVTPIGNEAPTNGIEVLSAAFEGPVAPTVTSVSIVGSNSAGSTVLAKYDYLHKYGVKEGKSVIEWYSGNNCIGTGEYLTLTSSMSNVYVKVTVVSEEYPYTGNTVQSAAISVNKSSSSGGGISSGFGGGGGKKSTTPSTSVPDDNTATVTPGEFYDTKGHWASDTIKSMTKLGYINGVSETSFEPDRSITRAEFCAIICRAFEITDEGNGGFADVSANDWFADFVNAAAGAGLFNGDAEHNFNPNEAITREEMAVVMYNLSAYKNKTLAGDTDIEFIDSNNISDWAQKAVDVMAKAGLLQGSDGVFNPKSSATRAEAIVVIERLLKILK